MGGAKPAKDPVSHIPTSHSQSTIEKLEQFNTCVLILIIIRVLSYFLPFCKRGNKSLKKGIT